MTWGGAETVCVRLARLSGCSAGILTSHPPPLPLGTPFKGQQGCLPKPTCYVHLLLTARTEASAQECISARAAADTLRILAPCPASGTVPTHAGSPALPQLHSVFSSLDLLGTPWTPLRSLPPSPRRCGASSVCLGALLVAQ